MMNLDCADLAEGDPVLYQQLVRYPAEVVVLLDQEAHTIWAHFAGASPDAGPQFTARHLDLCFCPQCSACLFDAQQGSYLPEDERSCLTSTRAASDIRKSREG